MDANLVSPQSEADIASAVMAHFNGNVASG